MSILSREEQLNLVLSFQVASRHLLEFDLNQYNNGDQAVRVDMAKDISTKVISDLACAEGLKEQFKEHVIGTVYAIYETARFGAKTDSNKQKEIIMLSEDTLRYRLLEKGISLGVLPDNFEHGPSH